MFESSIESKAIPPIGLRRAAIALQWRARS